MKIQIIAIFIAFTFVNINASQQKTKSPSCSAGSNGKSSQQVDAKQKAEKRMITVFLSRYRLLKDLKTVADINCVQICNVHGTDTVASLIPHFHPKIIPTKKFSFVTIGLASSKIQNPEKLKTQDIPTNDCASDKRYLMIEEDEISAT